MAFLYGLIISRDKIAHKNNIKWKKKESFNVICTLLYNIYAFALASYRINFYALILGWLKRNGGCLCVIRF